MARATRAAVAVLEVERDLLARGGRAVDGEGRECLEWEGSVALGARGDECRGEGEDLVLVERSVERTRPGGALQASGVDPGCVARLGGEDHASGGED